MEDFGSQTSSTSSGVSVTEQDLDTYFPVTNEGIRNKIEEMNRTHGKTVMNPDEAPVEKLRDKFCEWRNEAFNNMLKHE